MPHFSVCQKWQAFQSTPKITSLFQKWNKHLHCLDFKCWQVKYSRCLAAAILSFPCWFAVNRCLSSLMGDLFWRCQHFAWASLGNCSLASLLSPPPTVAGWLGNDNKLLLRNLDVSWLLSQPIQIYHSLELPKSFSTPLTRLCFQHLQWWKASLRCVKWVAQLRFPGATLTWPGTQLHYRQGIGGDEMH